MVDLIQEPSVHGDANLICSKAIAYADLGYLVLPIYGVLDGSCACGDPNCPSPAKHPHRWDTTVERMRKAHKLDAITDAECTNWVEG